MQALDLTADIIDVRDIIVRFEDLDASRFDIETKFFAIPDNEGLDFPTHVRNDPEWSSELEDEYQLLKALLEELAGNGGDEEWRGEWYPLMLIKDSYFVAYAQELVEECGYISKGFPHWIAIDWEKTAEAVQYDYTYINVGDDMYWYR